MAHIIKLLLFFFVINTDWAAYQALDNSFQVKFPENYNIKLDSIDTELGRMEISHIYHLCKDGTYCNHEDPYSLFSLIYIQYPINTFAEDTVGLKEEIFKATIEQRMLEMEGSIDYETALDHSEYEGKFLRISNDEDQICKAKFIILEDKFIALQVITDKVRSSDSQIKRFLDSFRIIDQ